MKICQKCGTTYPGNIRYCVNDGALLTVDMAALVNTTLDEFYHLEALLGEGGCGAVFRARHLVLKHQVAIKILSPELSSNPAWLRRFQQEGRIAQRFRHPNAVTVFDLRVSSDSLTYMVMEYLQGRTLRQELDRIGKLSLNDLLVVLEQLGSVLTVAHAHGIVHRDIKPDNIMLARIDGRIQLKLLDLGLAKLLLGFESNPLNPPALTQAGQRLGTPAYMSPEQWGELARDGEEKIDHRTDIYSLGVMIYELVLGRLPFQARTLAEWYDIHLHQSFPLLHQMMTGIPASLGIAIDKALSKDRNDRQHSVTELLAEVRQALFRPALILPAENTTQRTLGNDQHSTQPLPALRLEPKPGVVMELPVNRVERREASENPVDGNQVIRFPQIHRDDKLRAAQGNAKPLSQRLLPAEPKPIPTTSVLKMPQSPPPVAAWRQFSLAQLLIAVISTGVFAGICGGALGWYFSRAMWALNSTPRQSETMNPMAGPMLEATALPDTIQQTELMSLSLLNDATEQVFNPTGSGWYELPSSQKIRLRIVSQRSGYLYVLVPGSGGNQMTLLTRKSVDKLGLKTNFLSAGEVFYLPGKGRALATGAVPVVEQYTLIFSPTQLTELPFLESLSAQTLTAEQQSRLNSFRQNNLTEAVARIGASDPATLSVLIPSVTTTRSGFVFELDLRHP